MKSPTSLALGALVALSLALVGCADSTSLGPTGPRAEEVLDVAESAEADSGELVVYPSDGLTGPGGGAATFGIMALPTLRDIRIGVVPATGAVTLGSAADYTISDKANGLVLMTGTNGTVTVTLEAAPSSYYRLQVMCGSTAAVSARKAAAEALGHVTFTEFVPSANCTRLFLGQFAPNASFSVRNAYRNLVISQGLAAGDSFWKVVSVGGNTLYAITRGTTKISSLNPVVVTSSSGLVTINTATYRGKGEARVNGSSTLAGINELPVEQYLYGVVPRELGPVAFPEVEAQKAQAVAARTYAIRGFGKRSSDGYDLLPTTSDQVYGGYSAEHPVSTAAVDATAGVVATYNGTLIDALFSSTSGGHTADSEEAFGNVLPYLRGVPDAERGAALVHVPTLEVFRAHANPASLRAAAEGDFESDWSRYHRWTFEWTQAEITQVISDFAGKPVGRVLAINVVERGPSGRALRVDYVTEAGTFTSLKDATRSALKYISAAGTPTSLLSTLFFIQPVIDPSTKETTGFRAYGGGWGHGVGLSQTGAVGMAQKGHTYEQILQFYYQGISLETIGGSGVSAVP